VATPALVVPPGLMTLSLIVAALSWSMSSLKLAKRDDVRKSESALFRPALTPPSLSPSATSTKNAGPLPAIAVAISSSF